jgi:hypothetical protein
VALHGADDPLVIEPILAHLGLPTDRVRNFLEIDESGRLGEPAVGSGRPVTIEFTP